MLCVDRDQGPVLLRRRDNSIVDESIQPAAPASTPQPDDLRIAFHEAADIRFGIVKDVP